VSENNDKKKLQDLYNEYNIPLPEEEPPAPKRPQPRPDSSAPRSDVPRKPDGTPYTLQEIRQIQAYREAMKQQQGRTGNVPQRAPARKQTAQGQNPPSRNNEQRSVRQNPPAAGYVPERRQNTDYYADPRQNTDPYAGRRQNTIPHRQNAAVPQYRRRKLGKPNPAALIFALLIVVVSAVSIGQIIENNRQPGTSIDHSSPGMEQSSDGAISSLPGSETGGTGETDAESNAEDLVLWNTVQVSNDTLDEGNLILVNYEHAYADADSISPKVLYGNKADTYQVSNTNISLLPVALDALDALANDFYAETGSREIIVVSGYRDVASQQSIYDSRVASQGEDMAKLYVATPGYSEHHTGLAIDMSFYTTEGKSVPVEEHEFGYWIHENCGKYGFILRYPDDKVDITKIGYESWHYRYVGPPHAAIMYEKDLCLEEYIAYLRNYTAETNLIWIQKDGSMAEVSPSAFPKEGTLVYFVPAEEGDFTAVRLPRGNIFGQYEISGNNADGFIVTVHIG